MTFGFGLSFPRARTGFASAYAVNGFDPTTVSDFTNNYFRKNGSTATFADTLTFSRASTATYTDANGILQTAASGVARIGNYLWNGTAWANNGLLLESEARTNLVLYSNTFSTSWIATNNTRTAASAISPDGTNNAWLWARSSTAAAYTQQPVAKAATAITYTGSIYVKKSVGDYFALRLQGAYPARVDVVFNITDGTISTAATATSSFANASASIQNVGNGWYRVTLTATSDTFTFINHVFSFNSNNVPIDGTDSAVSAGFIYGAQLEAAATRSSYISTTTATVTRAAEILQLPATNLAVGANDYTNTTYWPTTLTENGITTTKVGSGVETDGLPYIDVRYQGTSTGISIGGTYTFSNSRTEGATGNVFTGSAIVRVIAGSTAGLTGMRVVVAEEVAPAQTLVGQASSLSTVSTSDTALTASRTITTGNQARVNIALVFPTSTVVDVTYRIRGLQFDKAAARVTYPNISLQINGTMTGTPSTFTRWGGALTSYLMQSASVGAYEFDTNTNVALGADDVGNAAYWSVGPASNGITSTKVATGVDTDGLPYVDYAVSGTATAFSRLFITAMRSPALNGQTYTTSLSFKLVGGTEPAASNGPCPAIIYETAPSTYVSISPQTPVPPTTTETLRSVTYTAANAAINQINTSVLIDTQVGVTVNYTVRMKGLQTDKASSRLTYAVRGGAFTSGVNVPFNVASRHGATYLNGAVRGIALTASSSTLPFPVVNSSPLQIGPAFMGNIAEFRQWYADIGDAGLVDATKPPIAPTLSLTFDSSNTSYIVTDWSE